MVSLSLNCQRRQQRVNHRSREKAELPEHRSGKIFRKLITVRLVIASFQRWVGEGNKALELICGLLSHLLSLLLNKLGLIFTVEEGYSGYLLALKVVSFPCVKAATQSPH